PVAGAVQSGAGVGTERVRKEPLGGQAGTTQVTAGQARSTDEQLTWHANRHQLQVSIQYVQLHVADRSAYRHRCGCRARPIPLTVPGADIDGGLGGTVQIV